MNLEKIYHKIKYFIPEKLLYSSDYFHIRNLLNDYEQDKISSSRLDSILKDHLLYCLKEVPYYRENIDVSSVNINDISGNDLLKLFHFISKEIVNEEPEMFISDTYKTKKLMNSSSGGSTGVGIRVWYNKEFTDIERAFFDHEWGKLGFKFKTSKILRFGSDALKSADEYPCEIIGRKLACSPYHFNEKWLRTIVEEAEKFQPEFLHGYPSLVYEYLTYLENNSLKLPSSLKGCLLASEPILEHQLDMVKKYFGNKFSINYGLTERNVIGFSVLNDNHLEYKLNPIYGHVENRSTEISDFEIVGTSYWNKVMPLVRYCTKDYGQIKENTITKLEGRSQEFLVTKDNNELPGMSISIDKFIWEYITDIQIVQNIKGKVLYKMVPKDKSYSLTEQIFQDFAISQNKKWSTFFDIEFQFVNNIELTKSGKKKLIVNHLVKTKELK